MESLMHLLFAETFQKYQLMRLETVLVIILPCFMHSPQNNLPQDYWRNPYQTIASIPLPSGFKRTIESNGSFASWLRALPLKKNKTVFLYNGERKANQDAQFAVIDISVGKKDLQQCADAVIRLRSEYLYSQHRYNEIDFCDNNHHHYRLADHANRNEFDQYLAKIFSYCGTLSLSNQLKPVHDFKQVEAGDVLIYGGSPGHAMLVVDVAINHSGEKIYLLAQSYMPAQDIHVVINPANDNQQPWYKVSAKTTIETPEWVFKTSQLKTWP